MEVVERRKYSTTTQDDGVNYRDIAETMTLLGFPMNHSSARNYVVRVMKKFVAAYAIYMYGRDLSDERMVEIAKDPVFQSGVAELLHAIENQLRAERSSASEQILTDHGFEIDLPAQADARATPEEEEDDAEKVAGGNWADNLPGRHADVQQAGCSSSV